MKLNNESKILMEQLLDEYKLLEMKENIYLNKNNFYIQILNQLLKAEDDYNMNKKHIIIEKDNDIHLTGIKKSKYIPNSIINYNFNNNYVKITYKFIIHTKIFMIHLFVYKNNDIKMSKLDKYIKRIYIWLYVISQYSTEKCGNILDIYIHFINKKKQLPKEQKNILNEENVNSAVTTSCVSIGDILIYRHEEWFKVFIHETFHIFGIDFSNMNCNMINKKFINLFNINSNINSYEAYTEFWATIMNSILSSYFIIDKKETFNLKNNFLMYIDFFIEFERFFSLFQMVKILDYMGLSYKNIIESKDIVLKNLYKEKTSVFSYYIVKSILLYNYNDFIKWCENNNKNTLNFKKTYLNLNNLMDFIQKKYKNKEFLNDLKKMENIVKKNKTNKFLYETLRMTIIEI